MVKLPALRPKIFYSRTDEDEGNAGRDGALRRPRRVQRRNTLSEASRTRKYSAPARRGDAAARRPYRCQIFGLGRAASLLALVVLSFSSMVPISALAANARETNGHWSLQPLKAPVVPRTSNDTSPIDAYITARLATNGLALSPEADRATLIRRLSFDLIGLPPSP